jgi:hypothetical protein
MASKHVSREVSLAREEINQEETNRFSKCRRVLENGTYDGILDYNIWC